MKLILLRHAKSTWDDPFAEDHDRVLNARGRDSAKAIGDWLRREGHLPDRVLCSSSARTRETLALLDLNEAEIVIDPSLYLASVHHLAKTIAEHDDVESLMVLAHNPGLGDLAVRLAAGQIEDDAFFAFPTCACLVLDAGAVVDFMVPRRLLEA